MMCRSEDDSPNVADLARALRRVQMDWKLSAVVAVRDLGDGELLRLAVAGTDTGIVTIENGCGVMVAVPGVIE